MARTKTTETKEIKVTDATKKATKKPTKKNIKSTIPDSESKYALTDNYTLKNNFVISEKNDSGACTIPALFTTVKFKKLTSTAKIPTYAHDGDMGMDVYADDVEYDQLHGTFIYHTGIAMETEKGTGALGFARSGIVKKSSTLGNGVGVLDPVQYRGEIMFVFRPLVDMVSYVNREAIREYMMLPWYKRWFTRYSEFCIDHADRWRREYFEQMPYKIGERIGQIVITIQPDVKIEVVDELSETERGSGGFNSTGTI